MVDIVGQVQQMYDEIGSHFSRTRQKTYGTASLNWPVTDQYLKKLESGQSVLDIGCGNGKLVSGLPPGIKYLGTDFSKVLISEAKKLFPSREFVYGDVVDTMHWEGLGRYDAIFCVAVLHHIPEKDQQVYVLKEMKNHLKENGFVYLTVWNLWQEKFAQYQVDDHFEIPYNKKWMRYCVGFDVQTLTNLFVEAGLTIEEMFYADKSGNRSDIMDGQNLVVVAR